MQLYQQFIKFCESLLAMVTTQWLIYGALMMVAFFLVWIVFAIITSSVRRFYIKCDKLEWFLIHNNIGYDQINSVDPYCRKISRSFAHAWNKFKKSNGKKPSDFLTKREVLDSEVSDGVLNHGKTFMKTFIGVTTVLLFIFNLALLGKDSAFNFGIFVESLFLPFVYYVVMILLYFVSNLIRHHMYIVATAHFYALVDELDDAFKIAPQTNFAGDNYETNVVVEDASEEIVPEKKEQPINEAVISEEVEPEELAAEESVENEEIEIQQPSDEEPAVVEGNNQKPFMADLSAFEINPAIKNSDSESEAQELTEQQEISEELDSENNQEQTQEEITPVAPIARNWEAEENLEYYDVFKKKNINVDKYINEIPNEEEFSSPFINVDGGYVPTDDMAESVETKTDDEQPFDEVNHPLNEFENNDGLTETEKTDESLYDIGEKLEDETESAKAEVDLLESKDDASEYLAENETSEIESLDEEDSEKQEDEDENETQDDSSEKAFNLSDLLAGEDEEESFDEEDADDDSETEEDLNEESQDIQTEDFDFFADEENDASSKVDIFDDEDNENPALEANELKSQIEQNLNDSSKEIDSKLEETVDANIDLSALVGEYKQNYHEDDSVEDENVEAAENQDEKDTNKNTENEDNNSELAKDIYAKINDLEDLIHSAISNSNKGDEKSTKTRKTKKGKTKMTTETEKTKKSRGRPKMQAIDENLKITNEQEFEEILSRAEKLMRKSESGLSQSQSKRIEKELKIMMDAMNKYKEGK